MSGDDELHGGDGDDYLRGGDDNDTLYGDDGEDLLQGGYGNDVIYGGNDYDIIYGQNGDDYIAGGDAGDTLWGHGGADTFAWLAGDTGADSVKDFSLSDGDVLDVSNILSGYDEINDAITDFVQITDNGTDSFLYIDVDGGADNFVHMANIKNITGLTDEEALETAGTLITA